VEGGSVYEQLSRAYVAKNDKPKAMAELERYAQIGGRDPELLKQLATLQSEAGKKKEATVTLERLNLIYLHDEKAHQLLGDLYSDLMNYSGAIREYKAVLDAGSLDKAGGHFQLAKAYKAANRNDDALEEIYNSLEAAPGFKPAQALLRELSAKPSGK